uniref:Uncharacterized protein n=1 Tax=Onchocerca volvulus TaxID=6282 RepID=A0A8R1XXU5_ONCVO
MQTKKVFINKHIHIAGVYSSNITLYYRNSPYRIQTDLTIETKAVLTIETGVKIYFDNGIGIKIKGTIWAVVSAIIMNIFNILK